MLSRASLALEVTYTPTMSRRDGVVLVVVFVVSRLLVGWIAITPDAYDAGGIVPASDVGSYFTWGHQLVNENQRAYTDVRIEYPPGSLPFMALPVIGGPDGQAYLPRFVATMAAIDALGFVAVLLLARRWGSKMGAWFWIAAIPLLGPTAYLRLDLVPAVATLWAVERGAARDWVVSGGALAFGAISKLYPVLLAPAGLIIARRRWPFALGFLGVVGALMLPFVTNLGDVASSVLGYHADRGIQVESLWGGSLFVASLFGYDQANVGFSFGALHFDGGISGALDTLSSIVSLAVAGFGIWLATRVERDDGVGMAEVWFAGLMLSLAVGSVFSPQFLVWAFALAAPVLCVPNSRLRRQGLTLLPIAAITQILFPFLYADLLAGSPGPVFLLAVRNLLVLWIGVSAAVTIVGNRREPLPEVAPAS